MSPPLLLLSKSCARRAPAPARPPLALHAAIRPDPAPLAPVRPAPARTVACGKWKRSDLNEILQHNLNAECRNVVGLIIFEAYQKKIVPTMHVLPEGYCKKFRKALVPPTHRGAVALAGSFRPGPRRYTPARCNLCTQKVSLPSVGVTLLCATVVFAQCQCLSHQATNGFHHQQASAGPGCR